MAISVAVPAQTIWEGSTIRPSYWGTLSVAGVTTLLKKLCSCSIKTIPIVPVVVVGTISIIGTIVGE